MSEGQGGAHSPGESRPGVSLPVARTYAAAEALIRPYRERTVSPTENSGVPLSAYSSLEKEDNFSDFCGTFSKKIMVLPKIFTELYIS